MGVVFSCFGLLDEEGANYVEDFESIPLRERGENTRDKELEVQLRQGQMASFIGL